jgi:hypothetical protein
MTVHDYVNPLTIQINVPVVCEREDQRLWLFRECSRFNPIVSVRCVPALRIDSEVIVTFRLGCWSDGVRQSGGDVPREEFLDAVDGMIGDASQHLV